MNYRTFSNLQFRQLLKSSFHSIHIDLRNRSGEKVLLVSVDITHLVLMFRKASVTPFQLKGRYKMFASRQVEIPLSGSFGRQRGRWFGAIAQIMGKNCNSNSA